MEFFKKLFYRPKLTAAGKKWLFISIYTILILYYLWCIPIVFFLNLPWEWLRVFLTCCYTLSIPAALILFRKDKRALWFIAGVCLFFGTWFSLIPASNNRDWTTDVAVLPSVTSNGDKVTIKNVRDFQYRSETDYTPQYYTETYDLNKLDSVDYILSYWDGNTLVAHTMLSFGFSDGKHLVVSVETRREKGEAQGAISGLYNQFELICILADESDVLLLRTNYRKEDVFVYPMADNKAKNGRKMLVQILKTVDKLETQPTFYNTIKHNCFTSLLHFTRSVRESPIDRDYRIIANGLSDEMGYERGWFKTDGLSFADFKKKCHINQYVQDDPDAKTDFSKKIRPNPVVRSP